MENQNKTNPATRISILIPTHAYFLSGIRDFTMTFVKNVTNLSEQWAHRFQSIIDELCNNAIEYGSSEGQDIKVTLSYEIDALTIIVEDTGTGKSKEKAVEILAKLEERRKPGYVFTGIRGRGLAGIIAGWTDTQAFEDIEDGGIRVKVTKKIDTTVKMEDEKAAATQPNTIKL